MGGFLVMPFNLLSKSKSLNGLQYPRMIWIQIHEPETIPEIGFIPRYNIA
jgi:hypothetical protein